MIIIIYNRINCIYKIDQYLKDMKMNVIYQKVED